jgi:ABC-2 type transport system permease protein
MTTAQRWRAALHAEWTKLWTTPGTLGLLLAVVVATVAASAATAGVITCPSGTCGLDPVKLSLTGVGVGQAVVAVLAVLVIGGEYTTGMLRVTLAAMPRRLTVLAAKAAVLTGVVTAAATVAVGGSLLAGRALLPADAAAVLSPDHGATLRAAVGSVLYLVLIGLLGLGTATAARSPAAAVGIVLGLLYVLPIVAQVIQDPDWKRHLQQLGPMSAGLTVQATVKLDSLPLQPWEGLAVVAGWAIASLVVGGLILRRRDA